jgi:hypothetical protein
VEQEKAMSPVIASVTRISPAEFSARLLEATRADCRRDPRQYARHAILLRSFLDGPVDPAKFEARLRDYQTRSSDLADTAREILALWRVCSR